MVRCVGADGKDTQIGGYRAVPSVFQRELSGIGFVKSRGRRGQHDGQIVVVAQHRWTGILDSHIGYGSSSHRTKVPGDRTSVAAARTAGRSRGLRGKARTATR